MEDDFVRYLRVMEFNARVPIALIHAVLSSMIARRSGIILNVRSRAVLPGIPLMTIYWTSKAALTNSTQGWAGALAQHGILCYSIRTELVQTELANAESAFSAAVA